LFTLVVSTCLFALGLLASPLLCWFCCGLILCGLLLDVGAVLVRVADCWKVFLNRYYGIIAAICSLFVALPEAAAGLAPSNCC